MPCLSLLRPGFIGELIGDLDHYVKEHFSDEEQLMKKFGYPTLAAHQEFKDGIFDLRGLLNFVVHWFLEHVQGTDRNFGTWAAQQNSKPV